MIAYASRTGRRRNLRAEGAEQPFDRVVRKIASASVEISRPSGDEMLDHRLSESGVGVAGGAASVTGALGGRYSLSLRRRS